MTKNSKIKLLEKLINFFTRSKCSLVGGVIVTILFPILFVSILLDMQGIVDNPYFDTGSRFWENTLLLNQSIKNFTFNWTSKSYQLYYLCRKGNNIDPPYYLAVDTANPAQIYIGSISYIRKNFFKKKVRQKVYFICIQINKVII